MGKKDKDSRSAKAGTIVGSCFCPHPYQDEKYGKGRRVFNIGRGQKGSCTSCGKDAVVG